ncbi:TRAP transporter substrate-binding protein [Amorphus sp. 3PC139-8]|uniref:TRAP transporter substrate-binding protein n=1 Tax=Amorphus sp. 3PC139-8 TaxID=2735676 RepID=UPI00345D3783
MDILPPHRNGGEGPGKDWVSQRQKRSKDLTEHSGGEQICPSLGVWNNKEGRHKVFALRIALLALAAGAALTSSMASAQDTTQLRFLTAWDDRFDGTIAVAQRFVQFAEEESDGRITFQFSGPEVVPPGQQFEPVSRGVFDVGFATPIYYIGTTGVPSAFFALPPDPAMWREKGYWDFADQELQRFNQKLIAFTSGSGDNDFYQVILREPLGDGDRPLAGRKIRGNKYYEPVVVPLGGSLVNLPIGETYSALEKGVVDGVAFPIAGMQRLKFQEVAGYMMRPRFGTSPFTVTMNLDKFKALSEQDQKAVLEAGRRVEESSTKEFAELADKTIADLKEAGMKEVSLNPELANGIEAGLVAGSWQTAIEGNPQTAGRVEELRKMARENGDAE